MGESPRKALRWFARTASTKKINIIALEFEVRSQLEGFDAPSSHTHFATTGQKTLTYADRMPRIMGIVGHFNIYLHRYPLAYIQVRASLALHTQVRLGIFSHAAVVVFMLIYLQYIDHAPLLKAVELQKAESVLLRFTPSTNSKIISGILFRFATKQNRHKVTSLAVPTRDFKLLGEKML